MQNSGPRAQSWTTQGTRIGAAYRVRAALEGAQTSGSPLSATIDTGMPSLVI